MRIAVAITIAALTLLAACGGTPASVGFAPIDHVCAPGQQIECACPGDAPKSVQSCRSDGSGYEACACTAGIDAGAAGDAVSSIDTRSPQADGGLGTDGARPGIGPDAGGSDAPSCSGSLDSDPENCGACGHSCLGGACQAGLCAFTELAANQVQPSGLAVADGNVFWTTEGGHPDYVGQVLSLSLMAAPGTTPTILATNQLYPRAVAFADGALFWGNQGDAKLGKWASDSTIAIGGGLANGHINNIVVDSAYVYFSMLISDSNGASPSGAIGRCSISGCGSTIETIATSPDAQIYGLALDSGVLYWSKYAANGTVSRLVLDGRSSPETIATGQAMPLQLAAFGGRVYWTSPGTSTVVSVSALGGEPPTIVARGQQAPWGIAVDASGVYWTNYDGDHDSAGQVMKLSPGSSTPIPLASGQSRPGHVRIDDAYAYWTNTGNGSIRRVPK